MSGLGKHRFLSRREKHHVGKHGHREQSHHPHPEGLPQSIDRNSPADFYGLFNNEGNKVKDGNEEQKVKTVRKRVMDAKGVMMKDAHILWALRSHFAKGDTEKASEFVLVLSDSSEFTLRDYNPRTKLLGSENRQAVTCYLDSVLFAIFAKLDSFEAMLINDFTDVPRSRLSLLLRVWVNLLRSGMLITAEFAALIQASLAECGWEDADNLRQQDASEAFTFITGKLELPLLTLKMDIYHTGKEDENDDHKFIRERLLEVAIPEAEEGKKTVVTLEDCLEEYFNNRIEVRRYLERRSTVGSMRSFDASKSNTMHVETVEVDADSPLTPLSGPPSYISRMSSNRDRAPSIIQDRYVPDRTESGYSALTSVDSKGPLGRLRGGSFRREVMMPAWQFFSLIPWYTDNAPSDDAQVAAHFSAKRPVLGICLKRYSVDAKGNAFRLNTQVDIPIEIGLPHFIQDDKMTENAPLFGNFKLSLQSVVCHRGNSVDSGHYIAFVRGTTSESANGSSGTHEDTGYWMRFDDLALQARITLVNIQQALASETPYLLFYQILPVDGDPGPIVDRPSVYSASTAKDSGVAGLSTSSLQLHPSNEEKPVFGRPSFEIQGDSRGRPQDAESRQTSIASEDLAMVGAMEEGKSQGSSPAGKKGGSLSRTESRTSDGLVKKIPKLGSRRSSKEELPSQTNDREIRKHEVSTSVSTMDVPLGPPRHQIQKLPHRSHMKRDKSKNRLSKMEKPDRECVVM